MHLKGLDLNLLVVLDALLSERNVTRTGQRINLSQPATSSALARLRDFFGDPLLIQVGQQMELTSLAKRLAQPVHEILLKCETVIDKNHGFHPETSTRTFRLNMSDYKAAVIMSRVLSYIEELAPQVRVEISSIVIEPTREYLERGYLDLIVTPAGMTSPLHPSEPLFKDQFAAVVWSGNPFASGAIDLETYLSANHIVAHFGKLHGWAPDEVFFARSSYQRHIHTVASSFSMLMSQIARTSLIATTYERLGRFYAQYFPLSIFPLPIQIPPEEIRMQWHRYQENDPGNQWLRHLLRKTAAELKPLSGGATAKTSAG